jgi:hypothetical protein
MPSADMGRLLCRLCCWVDWVGLDCWLARRLVGLLGCLWLVMSRAKHDFLVVLVAFNRAPLGCRAETVL